MAKKRVQVWRGSWYFRRKTADWSNYRTDRIATGTPSIPKTQIGKYSILRKLKKTKKKRIIKIKAFSRRG